MAKEEKASPILSIFKEALKAANKGSDKPALRLQEFQDAYGAKAYLSSGLPSLNMQLPHNPERTQYGFPLGKVVELSGAESSFKTTMSHMLTAQVLAQGGQAFWYSTEMDFDIYRAQSIYEEHGVKLSKDPNKLPVSVKVCDSLKDVIIHVLPVLDTIIAAGKALAEKKIDLPPTIIVLDSIAATMASKNKTRLEEDYDKGDQQGASGKEIHDLFKLLLPRLAEANAMFLFTNQLRANMGFGFAKTQIAHDLPIRHYASVRLGQKRGYDASLNKTVKRLGRDFQIGTPVEFTIKKIRGEEVLDGKTSVDYYFRHGFDYIGSLILAMTYASIAREKAKIFTIELDPESSSKLEKKLAVHNGKYALKDLRNLLKDDLKVALWFEQLCYERGPDKLEDMR